LEKAMKLYSILRSIRFREELTLKKMIGIYCHKFHGMENSLCEDCYALLDYSSDRLERCPFEDRKSTCKNCRVHCFKKSMREKVREIMKYSGPRLLLRNPLLTLLHFWDSRRKSPKNY